MILGFTGTRRGMSPTQMNACRDHLARNAISQLHHGDCVGADQEVHNIGLQLSIDVVIHPPINPALRAFCFQYLHAHPPRPYIERNRIIVDSTTGLLATPAEYNEIMRSGTWSTIRYAIKQKKPVTIIFPDGTITTQWSQR